MKIIDYSDRVEKLLSKFEPTIGEDFKSYRGHVYRVLTYAMQFLDGDEEARPIVETALAYHDLGLWTDRELAYLEPSEALVLADNESENWGFDPDALKQMIHWHHKVTPYHGPHQRLVEAVRKADWIDATKGFRRMGLTKVQVKTVEDAIPNYNFLGVLQRLARDYGGNVVSGDLQVLRHVYKW